MSWLLVLVGTSLPIMTQAEDETPTIIAVAACDSFAEIREQCAWIGGLVGFPMLAGLPDTYAMLATGGKGLKGLDAERPIGIVVTVDGEASSIHGFLPTTDPDALIETFSGVPFRSMVDMAGAGDWVVVTAKGKPPSINDPQDMLRSITSHLSVGVKLFPSRLPDTLKESFLNTAEQGLGSQEGSPGQQFGLALPISGFDKDIASESLAQTEALLFGLAIDKKTDRIFLESRTIFAEGGTAGTFWATAGGVEPSLGLPPQEGQYALQVQIAQNLNDATQLEAMEKALLSQIKQEQLRAVVQKLSTVILPQISEYRAFELVAGVAPPKNQNEGQAVPTVVLGMGIADGSAMAEQLKGLLDETDVEFDVAEDDGFSFHDIEMMPLGKVTLAIGDKCIYAMTRAADDSEYKAITGHPIDDFRPIAAANVRLESLFDGIAGLPPEMAMIVENLEPQGEVNLLVRPITRGLAIRVTADGEAVQTGAALTALGVVNLNSPLKLN